MINCKFQFDDYIYWTDWQQKSVFRADKINGKKPVVIRSGLEGAMGIAMITSERQKGWNPCAVNNGGCSQLCFYKRNNYTCGCPDDKKNCKTGKILITEEVSAGTYSNLVIIRN